MKETMDPTPAKPTGDEETFANRKLIRPALPRADHNHCNPNSKHTVNHRPGLILPFWDERPERGQDRGYDRGDRPAPGGGGGRKTAPPEQTNAENFYYQKQMQSRTPMVIVLQDGEEVHGFIE